MMHKSIMQIFLVGVISTYVVASNSAPSCRFSKQYSCETFQKGSPQLIDEYLSAVMFWEGKFAQPGVAYDGLSGYTFDGHPLNYGTGELYDEPHLFSAPSKESIHMALLAKALDGDKYALQFFGGLENVKNLLSLKIKGYEQFNATYPGFGCFTPWVGFNLTAGTFSPLDSWSNKVPGLDNGEWFWGLYAIADILETKYSQSEADRQLATQYRSFVNCQKQNAKMIFYRGNGQVSAVVSIKDTSAVPSPDNYAQESGYLDDPYEGETMTQILYLFSSWDSDEEREQLWVYKRKMFQKVDYKVPGLSQVITVQKGYWFSTHEQWKTLLLPYLALELPLVRKVFRNAEKARSWDAHVNKLPGLLASINDVTNGSQVIPDYASACGIAEISFQTIERRDLMTPYGSFGLFLHDMPTALCWYNNMLRGPRMQSSYGSTEAINANATEISPLTTWDSKITTVLAMVQGIGEINKRALLRELDSVYGTSYHRFVYVVNREHKLVFGDISEVQGENVPFALPSVQLSNEALPDWDLACA